MEQILKRLAEAITNSGYSLGELSDKTGIPKTTIHRYATGSIKKIPVDAVKKIASATGVSAAFSMGWKESETFEQKVLEITKKIPEDKREDFLAYLQASLEMVNK